MKNHCRLHTVIVLAVALLSFACSSPPLGGGGLRTGELIVLDRADSLLEANPDSALHLLEAIDYNKLFHFLSIQTRCKCCQARAAEAHRAEAARAMPQALPYCSPLRHFRAAALR